jgi:hypothetical protein
MDKTRQAQADFDTACSKKAGQLLFTALGALVAGTVCAFQSGLDWWGVGLGIAAGVGGCSIAVMVTIYLFKNAMELVASLAEHLEK